MSARRSAPAPTCEAPGCANSAPVSLTDRNGTVSVCYGHADNTLTALREAIAGAR